MSISTHFGEAQQWAQTHFGGVGLGDDHHNGACFLTGVMSFWASFGQPRPQPLAHYPAGPQLATPDGYAFYQQLGPTRAYMTDDQRFASHRPDVLTYQTPPLEADMTLAGPIEARLQVATTGTDADWVVKVIDVYPDRLQNPSPSPLP